MKNKRCVWVLEGRSLRGRNWKFIRPAYHEEIKRRRPTAEHIGGFEYRLRKYVPEDQNQ